MTDDGRQWEDVADDPDEPSLVFEDEAHASGFTMVPNAVLRTTTLSRDAKTLYAILLSYAWQSERCFPGYETLTRHLGCARSQASAYMKELKDAGLVAVERRTMGLTNRYTILRIPRALLAEMAPDGRHPAPLLYDVQDNGRLAGRTSVDSPAGQRSSRRQDTKNTQSKKTQLEEDSVGDTVVASDDAAAEAATPKAKRVRKKPEDDPKVVAMVAAVRSQPNEALAKWQPSRWDVAEIVKSDYSPLDVAEAYGAVLDGSWPFKGKPSLENVLQALPAYLTGRNGNGIKPKAAMPMSANGKFHTDHL